MDQIQAMRIFTRVVEAGTFTRAADSLSLPKATVTKHVQALEERLRVKLLNRTTRRVTVTADGAAYYERTVRLLLAAGARLHGAQPDKAPLYHSMYTAMLIAVGAKAIKKKHRRKMLASAYAIAVALLDAGAKPGPDDLALA